MDTELKILQRFDECHKNVEKRRISSFLLNHTGYVYFCFAPPCKCCPVLQDLPYIEIILSLCVIHFNECFRNVQ